MRDLQTITDIGFPRAHLLQSHHPKSTDYDTLLGDEDVRVVTPEGELLFAFQRNAFPADVAVRTYEILDRGEAIHKVASNRGSSRGKLTGKPIPQPTQAGIIGFLDRSSRAPFCRPSAFVEKHPQSWATLQPIFRYSNTLYETLAPCPFKNQRDAAEKVVQDWLVPDTVFSTATVNANNKTAYHYDRGDLTPGFVCMAVFRAGNFLGGHLVFPRYRIAIDLPSNSFITYNAHELHGNTPFRGTPGTFKRLSLVMYLRENMHRCLPADLEILRVQNRKSGDPLYG